MKAPDKIYIQPNAHDGWFENGGPSEIFVEYIRKDALLEWAKETKAELEAQNCIKDDIRKGAVWELEEIIEKLNSM